VIAAFVKTLTLDKTERLCSKKLIETLFGGGACSMSVFPLRVVFMKMKREGDDRASEVLVSVSKRSFRRAVKRNRVKRQIREAYRKNKQIILQRMEVCPDEKMVMAFLWLDDKLYNSSLVEKKMISLLQRVAEKV
jgi:ribonuclease P protein component